MVKEDFKSTIEYYFYLYCLELKKYGFIEKIGYEVSTYSLCDPYERTYLQELKSKVVKKTENLLRKSSITADFSIKWTTKAKNIFYLDTSCPIKGKVKDIPFRLYTEDSDNIISLIETKGMNESTTSSSISFVIKQKQCQKDHNVYIQKIRPYWSKPKSDILFQNTFTPREVLKLEVYKRDCKWGKKGESKIKYPVIILKSFLKSKL